MTLVGGFGCDELVLYGIRDRHRSNSSEKSSTSRWITLESREITRQLLTG